MSLDTFTITRPNARNGGSDPLELCIEQYYGEVLSTLERRSVLKPIIPFRPVRGTSTIRNEGVGESSLGVITPGVTPNASQVEFGKNTLTVDTPLLARVALPMLDEFQSNYDKRAEIGKEHGKVVAKFVDQTLAIAAIKAGLSTVSAFHDGTNELPGHGGGTQHTLAAAGDENDPAKLDLAINAMLSKIEENKDVDVLDDGGFILVRPAVYYRLLQAERLISTEFITSAGNTIKTRALASHGVPIMASRNFPAGQTITGHLLSNSRNGNFFDGNFSKLVGLYMTPEAILAGETIAFTPNVFWDELSKSWYVDLHGAFSVTTRRHEHAGVILAA